MKKEIGVYIIRNNANGKVYVGSSTNLEQRKNSHFISLKGGYHTSKLLQWDYNIYGKWYFDFIVVESINPRQKRELLMIEQYYIEKFDSIDNGYNTVPATAIRGWKPSEQPRTLPYKNLLGTDRTSFEVKLKKFLDRFTT